MLTIAAVAGEFLMSGMNQAFLFYSIICHSKWSKIGVLEL